MGVSVENNLKELLVSIKHEIPKINIISLVSTGGHLIVSTQDEFGEPEIVLSAMTAALISISEQASLKLNKGTPNKVVIECPKGLMVIKRVNDDVLLAVVTDENAPIELLLDHLNKKQSQMIQLIDGLKIIV